MMRPLLLVSPIWASLAAATFPPDSSWLADVAGVHVTEHPIFNHYL